MSCSDWDMIEILGGETEYLGLLPLLPVIESIVRLGLVFQILRRASQRSGI